MNILDIIEKKRDNKKLTKQEINFFVREYTNGNIQDYQAAALIMAIYINGMDMEEITDLTISMAHSGDVLDLSSLGTVVDKHSTGGIGDKITIILTPIIASIGIPVAKMSGRGLGITGGTIDKLEAIPGFNTNVDIKTFIENVRDIGISLIGQTIDLAPADKKLYELRDTICCTESIPLIASSIMSKKIAAGAQKIVLDITVGSGAFMKNIDDAKRLAITMKKIGELSNKETICIITNMEEPLGYTIGNSLEIIEAVKCLQGQLPDDIEKIVLELGAYIIKLAGKGNDINKNKELIIENIENGNAYKKLLELVKKQGGDISYIENPDKFKRPKYIKQIISCETGYVKNIVAERIAKICSYLGAGRINKSDSIDSQVGIILNKKVASKVKEKEVLATIYANDQEKLDIVLKETLDSFIITDEKIEKPKYIIDII